MIHPSSPIAAEREEIMHPNHEVENLSLECVWIVSARQLKCKWVERSQGSGLGKRESKDAPGAERQAA
jgi:hypothetical protein